MPGGGDLAFSSLLTKVCLVVSGRIPHHKHYNQQPSSASQRRIVAASRFARNFIMSLIRCRRVTKKLIIQSAIISALLICLMFFIIYSIVLYSMVDRTLPSWKSEKSRSQVRFISKHPKDVLLDNVINEALAVKPKSLVHLQSQHKVPQSGRKAAWRSIHWDIDGIVRQYNHKPTCNSNAILLILITTAPENAAKRQGIRDTWCSPKLQQVRNSKATYNAQVQCVFLIGHTNDTVLNQNISQEGSKHGDILAGVFHDTYRNLTYKVLSGFSWSRDECSAPFVLKTDDDCFVNVPVLSELLVHQSINDGFLYIGRVFKEESNRLVIRDKRSKWAVSENDFFPSHYPPYASGWGYLLSQSLLRALVQESRSLPPFPNEDAYVGVLAESVGAHPIDSLRFTYYNMHWAVCNFLYLLVIHQVGVLQQFELNAMVTDAPSKCKGQTFITTWD